MMKDDKKGLTISEGAGAVTSSGHETEGHTYDFLGGAVITDKHFADWEGHVFGFGYGTGEDYIIPALWGFLRAIPQEGTYDYKVLEALCGGAVCWLLINTLCHDRIIEYGTSPRFGWLTAKGKALTEYVGSQSLEHLLDVVGTDDDTCYPDHCNCEEPCNNPLWGK